jgi:hypothetical protein
MVDDTNSRQPQTDQMLETVSLGSKEFYSAGATFSTLACAAVVAFAWGGLTDVYAPCKSHLCGLVLSFAIVFAYALVIPEPQGYPNAGKLRVTTSEILFGIVNSIIVFSTAVALTATFH